jgi:CRP-like cAMP-binding protein
MDQISDIEQVRRGIIAATGMSEEAFELSAPYWQHKEYKKGEYFNEYKSVCKHLGFVLNGVFRIYWVNPATGEERNMLFFTERQFVTSYQSFLTQTSCNYYTESMISSTILYIHIDRLHQLYKESHEWEHFGRILAESAFASVMKSTEGFLLHTAEERYLRMIEEHPMIINSVPLYHIASYLGIQGPSLSRIRKRLHHFNSSGHRL